MGVLVGQDHPDAMRRTPSSGDGGVDLLIPEGDGWHVRQVKGFTGRMTAKRRRQVEKSFAAVIADPRLGRPIVRWTLAVPIDATSDEQAWFESLTADAGFTCHWEGELFWNGIAAKHPHVIDYYLRDSRARIEDRCESLLAVTRSASEPVSATDVAGHLEILRSSLNRDDPHYRYEFATSRTQPEPQLLPAGCVLMSSRTTSDSGWLTIYVYEMYRGALEDAPIRGSITVTVLDRERGIDIRDAFEEFRMWGVAVDLPDGTLSASTSAPGGLGGEFEDGSGQIIPRGSIETPQRTRLRLVHPDDGIVAELGLRHLSVTSGDLGGIDVRAVDDAEVLEVHARLWPPQKRSRASELQLPAARDRRSTGSGGSACSTAARQVLSAARAAVARAVRSGRAVLKRSLRRTC